MVSDKVFRFYVRADDNCAPPNAPFCTDRYVHCRLEGPRYFERHDCIYTLGGRSPMGSGVVVFEGPQPQVYLVRPQPQVYLVRSFACKPSATFEGPLDPTAVLIGQSLRPRLKYSMYEAEIGRFCLIHPTHCGPRHPWSDPPLAGNDVFIMSCGARLWRKHLGLVIKGCSPPSPPPSLLVYVCVNGQGYTTGVVHANEPWER